MEKKRWQFSLALLLCLVPFMANVPSANAESKTTILLDDYPLSFPAEPKIIDGTTMVPFRAIAEALRIPVAWDAASKTITAVQKTADGDKEVVLELNSTTAKVDGAPVALSVSPVSAGGTTLIPLSFFSKQFGADVSWDAATKTVRIVSPQTDMYSLAFYAISSFGQKHLIEHFDAVSFGWARIDGDGRLTTEGKDFYWPKPAGEVTPEQIVADASQEGAAAYLMVFAGDDTGELTKLIEDSALTENAVAEMVKLALEKKFSGISLDFEGLGLTGDIDKAKASYTAFVKKLAAETKKAGLKLSLVLHPLNGAYRGYDYAALGALADEIIVMAYAYEGEKGPEPLKRVDEAIRLALQEVTKEKLVLGISMGSENEQSVGSKIGLAKRYDLKGVAIWRLGLVSDAAMTQIGSSISPLRSL
ncbi:stalk domain-containing protein [Paenibacillus sp. MSJ-34]|uniref:stalk domain-containing protein n=1 Tax=Paenibacillus sp. MSJ-34 TaxID=2841529 RepID=UPI001C1191EA|nr:stalk domain-containing protein [Paenibacillus sp. MSJ-34]MBU5440510.1 glycosyl hydrolase [Paenibacillus sp. MSJ-34]